MKKITPVELLLMVVTIVILVALVLCCAGCTSDPWAYPYPLH